jgi:hypothetical protein
MSAMVPGIGAPANIVPVRENRHDLIAFRSIG